MNTPAICLTKHDLGDARKAFDVKVAEVKRIDESNARDSHITAARIMLDSAIAERGAIVASINDQAKSGQFNVDWGSLAIETGEPVHVEEDQQEIVTNSVINVSMKKSASNTSNDLRGAYKDLLKSIDDAIANAETSSITNAMDTELQAAGEEYTKALNKNRSDSSRDKGILQAAKERLDAAKQAIGYVTFDVAGDGKFQVINNKEKLIEFKKRVESNSSAFSPVKKSAEKGISSVPSSPSSSIAQMLEDGEKVAAYELAKTIGKPFRFGYGNKREPLLYIDTSLVDLVDGLETFVGKSADKHNSPGKWFIIETTTGQAIGGAASSAKEAKTNAEKRLKTVDVAALIQKMRSIEAIGQDALEAKWLEEAQKSDDSIATGQSVEEASRSVERLAKLEKKPELSDEKTTAPNDAKEVPDNSVDSGSYQTELAKEADAILKAVDSIRTFQSGTDFQLKILALANKLDKFDKIPWNLRSIIVRDSDAALVLYAVNGNKGSFADKANVSQLKSSLQRLIDASEKQYAPSKNVEVAPSPLEKMQAAKADKALDAQVRMNGEVMTKRAMAEKLVNEGAKASTREEDKIKPMSRMAFHRADQREQDEHDRRVREAGKKVVYSLGDYDITKTEYDYAQKLISEKSTKNTEAESNNVHLEGSQSYADLEARGKVNDAKVDALSDADVRAVYDAMKLAGNKQSVEKMREVIKSEHPDDVEAGLASVEKMNGVFNELFNSAPIESTKSKIEKDKNDFDSLQMNKVIASIRSFEKKLADQLEDWSTREYKANKTSVELHGDGLKSAPSMSINAINESKRRKVVDSLKQQIGSLSRMIKEINEPDGERRVYDELKREWIKAGKAAEAGEWSGLKTQGDYFEYSVINEVLLLKQAYGTMMSNEFSGEMRKLFEAAKEDGADKSQEKSDGSNGKKLKNYSWDRVALSANYNNEQLNELMRQVEEEHANERKDGRYYENGNASLYLYDKEGRRKLDNISWAITHNLKKEKNQVEKPIEIPVKTTALSSVIDSTNAKTGEGLTDADQVINIDINTIEDHKKIMALAADNKISVDQIKQAYASTKTNEESIKANLISKKKDDLLKAGGRSFAANHKTDNKEQIVRSLFSDMMSDYAYFSSESLTYVMGEGSRRKAIDSRVDALTQDDLVKYAAEQQRKNAEAKAWIDERLAKMKSDQLGAENPVTLSDFQANVRIKMAEGKTFAEARMMLTLEQRAEFDNLAGKFAREERAKKKVAQQEQSMHVPGEPLTATETIKTKHAKHGYDLWQFNLDQRVSKEEYQKLSNQARRLGGDYSSYRGNGAIPGWQFKAPEAAQAFKDLIAGDNTAAKEVMGARRDAFADDRSQSASERLNEMASALEQNSRDSLNQDRKTNTNRRAGMASRAEANARDGIALAMTMRNIASWIENGSAQFLDKVREKKQVSMLTSAVNVAQHDKLIAKGLSYAEMEKQKGMPADQETADFAAFPSYTAYRSDLASLARQLMEVDGTKLFGKRLLDVADDVSDVYLAFAKANLNKVMTFSRKDGGLAAFSSKGAAESAITRSGYRGQAIPFMVKRGEYAIIQSPSAAIKSGAWSGDHDKRITLSSDFGSELVEKIGRAARRGNKVSVPWQFEVAYDKRKTLSRMNIETAAEYRAALREFIALREVAEAPNKITELERSMVGRQNDGMDFFPTPESTADQMIDVADIQPGMNVLEPSAGWGHIAEKIREAGVEPDVVELSGKRRELLEAKGFNVVGSDFLELKARQFFTYGDVFRDQDGNLGIMSGSGGMGSNRVGFYKLDENGQMDRRQGSWLSREDLEGVELRGTQSGYDRIIMNPPFSDRRDAEHVQHAYSLLKPGGRLVAIMGEGVFFGKDSKANEFRNWLDSVGGTDEKLEEGTFLDPSLPVNTSVSARMVVINKPDAKASPVLFSQTDVAVSPESQLSEEALYAIAESALSGLENAPPIVVLDSSKLIESRAIGVKSIPMSSGAMHDGTIYLFRDGIRDSTFALTTIWHELFHYGLRKLMTPEMYISNLNKLYNSDENIKRLADYWKTTEDASLRQKERITVTDMHLISIEEALAMTAENVKIDGDNYVGVKYKSTSVRKLLTWMADIAKSLRLNSIAQALRTMTLSDGEKFVKSIFKQMEDGTTMSQQSMADFDPKSINYSSANDNPDTGKANSADIRYKVPSTFQYFEPNKFWAVDDLQKHVDDITKNWANKPRIRVVEFASELPFEAKASAQGVYYDGNVYLVADNIRSEEQAQFVLMHEVLGHAGLRGLFGGKLNGKLIALAANNKLLSKAAAQWRNENRSQSKGISESDFFALSIEEVLADMAGSDIKMTGFDAFIAALQKALRAINLSPIANWLEGRTHAEVISMLSKAKRHIEQGSTDRTIRTAFAPAYSSDPSQITAEDALAEIASMSEAFRVKASEGETMESITSDVDPSIKVRKITSIPGETRYELILPDETMARIMVRPFNKYGKSIYGFDMDENNEMTNQVTERPGKNAEEAYGKDDMWIDVSLLNEGGGFGAKIYHIAANYAHNTGKVFIGDPAGVTHAALLRRPEQMLSSALKFGTTEHLAPHPTQIRGNAKNGIASLDWVYGDDVGNIQKLIDLTVKNIDNVGGIGGIEYDGQSGEFIDSAGSRITREDLRGLAQVGLGRAAQAGGRTLERYAFLSASLQSLRGGLSRRESGEMLVRIREQLRNHVSAVDQNGSLDQTGKRDAKQLFYSTGSPSSLTASLIDSVNNVKNVKLPANYLVGDLFDRSGQISWWDKTVGTPYNLAKRNPLFANVYNRIQSFIGDVSMFTAEAADLAPTILPKLEKLADLKKMPLTAEDTKAISAAIFEGTLAWARDENGRAIKVKDSDDAKAGVKWEDQELRDIFNLNDKQIGLYKEFRAAIDKSLTNLAISDMVKVIGKDYRHLMTPALEKGNVTAASEFLSEYFNDLAATDEENSAAHFDTVNMLMNKAEKANDLMDRGYAPLSRFGKHTVYVEEAGEQVYFGLYESKMEAVKAARNMRADYPNATVTSGTMSEEAYKLFAGVSIETVELFGDMLGLSDPDTSDATREAYQAYLKMAKNNRSSMKRLINRKGIAGFSEDAGRVLANFVYSNGRMTSANVHMGELDEAVNAIPKIQGELKDAAVQLSEHVKNPENAGTKLGGLMFAQYLGGSVASAMVNLTQPLMMTMPYLSQYGGIKSASSELVAAARDAYKETTGDKALDAALKLAEEEGIVSPQEVHHIQAQAAGDGSLQAGDGTLFGDAKATANNGMKKIMLGWGKFFSLAEQTNRRITFIAAYRTAIAQNIPNPAKFAEEAIAATQGTYNCVDAETECLTESGWKRHSELVVGEKLFALNEAGNLVESRLIDVHRYHDSKGIHATEFGNENGFSMVLTGDHTCLAQNYSSRDKKYQRVMRVKASEMKIGHHVLRVPLADDTNVVEVYTDDEVRLFAWVAAEGFLFRQRNCKEKKAIAIVQCRVHNPHYVAEIDALLDRLGGHYARCERRLPSTIIQWKLRKHLWSKVNEALPGKMITFDLVKKLSPRQMGLFLEIFTSGDGHRPSEGGNVITQKDKGNLDALQAMAILSGQSSTVTHRVPGMDWGRIYLSKTSKRAYRKEMSLTPVLVDMVWCPQTEHGTWIARRNGRTFVTGNSGNKPRWARNTLGSLAMTFKQYSIAYVELLSRMWNAGEPGSPERAAGRRGALYMLAVLFIMSGADGLPFEQDLEDLIDTILQKMGYNFSTKRKKEQFFVDVLGEGGADFALKGVSGITGVPIDLAGRLGMGNLIPATGLFKNKESHVKDVAELAGAPGDFVVRSYNALNNAASGNFKGAVEEFSPRAVTNAIKGAGMMASGQAVDSRGYKINDVSVAEGAMKVIGFQPNSTAHVQDDKGQALDLMAQARAASSKIQEHWAQGLAKGDADMVQEAREMRDEWNVKNPESPIRTNMPAIIKRVRNMKMDAMQRTQNTAPKAMKAAVREELAS